MAKPARQTVVAAVPQPTSSPSKAPLNQHSGTALVQVAEVAAPQSTGNIRRVTPTDTLPSPAEYEEINREITRQVRSQEAFELSDGDDPMLAEWGRVLVGLAIVLGLLYSLKYILLKWRASHPKKKRPRRLPPAIPTQVSSPAPRTQQTEPTRSHRLRKLPTTPPSLSWEEVVDMIAASQSPDEDTAPASGTNPVGLNRLRRPRS
jgi:hypothetical protein